MRTEKMLAALLAGLIILSLTGCGADKINDGSESGAISTESSITATVTDSTSEPTAESSLPAESEIKTDESTAEKEKAESTAPADSGRKADTAKPAETELPTVPPKQTEPPKVTEPPKSKPDETPKSVDSTPTETAKPESAGPQFDINYWIEFARKYAENIGLAINPEAVSCWDNPIIAGPNSKYLERDIKARMNRYKNVEGFTDIWVWAEPDENGNYRLFIGYA